MVNVFELIRDSIQSFFSKKFGESRELSDPVQPDDFGPIIRELIDRGVIPADFEELPEARQRRLIARAPDREIVAARNSVRPMTTFRDYMSVALEECGNDQRTFRQLTQLWNREKETIQGLTKAELRDVLECP